MASRHFELENAIDGLLGLNLHYVSQVGQAKIILKFRDVTSIVNFDDLNTKLEEIDNEYATCAPALTARQKIDFQKKLQRAVLSHVYACMGLVKTKNDSYNRHLQAIPGILESTRKEYKENADIRTDMVIDQLSSFYDSLQTAAVLTDSGFITAHKDNKPLSTQIAPAIHICLRTMFVVSLQHISFSKKTQWLFSNNVDKDDVEETEMDARLANFESNNKALAPGMTRVNMTF
ncbi:hypothetical protein H4219_005857 [Mycoemilia scoparia]|uniref:Uncharacterized protein n=1 Tax=Mycoemilia scoparia TaxID=417184 RepID=A0A9W8DNE2_9FUNG|nr:hypothetical protein H4219_005857 [Mycoemilia scoparia]